MKHLLPWAVLAFIALGVLALIDRACSSHDPAYWVRRADYDAQVQAAAAEHKDDLAKVDAALAVVADKDQVIAALTAAAGQPSPAEVAKDREIAELEKKIAGYEAQGDLAGALAAAKAENKAWAEKFSLAAGMHQESLTALNKAWQAKFDAQVSISATWQAAYEREHALRLSCESLVKDLERGRRPGRVWKYAAPAAAFIAGYLIGK